MLLAAIVALLFYGKADAAVLRSEQLAVDDESQHKPLLRKEGAVEVFVNPLGLVESIASVTSSDDNAGPVSDALDSARAEINNQITENTKARGDTIKSMDKMQKEIDAKQEELKKAWEAHQRYLAEHGTLEKAIGGVMQNIARLTELSTTQQGEIDRLVAAHASKLSAKEAAHGFELEVESLTKQIKLKGEIMVQTQAKQLTENEQGKQQCSASIDKLDKQIATLTATISSAREQHHRLTEEHTTKSCPAKLRKKETICVECDGDSPLPCGDDCTAAGEKCYHDHGCACHHVEEPQLLQRSAPTARPWSLPASLLQKSDPKTYGDAMANKKKIADAKAEINKMIGQHQDNIDNLREAIENNKQTTSKTKTDKADAIDDFDQRSKDLGAALEKLKAARDAALSKKTAAEKKLEEMKINGAKVIGKIGSQWQELIDGLMEERQEMQNQRAAKVISCEEEEKSRLTLQGTQIATLKSEISQLTRQKQDAEAALEKLKNVHNIDVEEATEKTAEETAEKAKAEKAVTEKVAAEKAVGAAKKAAGNTNEAKKAVATKKASKATSYYRTIKGVKYDRQLLEFGEEALKTENAISLAEAKELWSHALDGNRVTPTELITIEYIMQNMKITEPGTKYLQEKWEAAGKTTEAKKPAGDTTEAKKVATAKKATGDTTEPKKAAGKTTEAKKAD